MPSDDCLEYPCRLYFASIPLVGLIPSLAACNLDHFLDVIVHTLHHPKSDDPKVPCVLVIDAFTLLCHYDSLFLLIFVCLIYFICFLSSASTHFASTCLLSFPSIHCHVIIVMTCFVWLSIILDLLRILLIATAKKYRAKSSYAIIAYLVAEEVASTEYWNNIYRLKRARTFLVAIRY